jgi:predicted HD phosphohydrolase
MDSGTENTVGFVRMADGTYEDYQLLDREFQVLVDQFPDEALAMLKRLAGDKLGYKIDRYDHSLQSATRAFRDGADEETVVCALLHDIGDVLAPLNHSDLAAAVLQPYVSDKNHWIIRHHGIFQGYYYFHHTGGNRDERERYRGHPYFEACAAFCENWDQNSFDPDYDTMPLTAFEPMVRRILGRKAFAWQE